MAGSHDHVQGFYAPIRPHTAAVVAAACVTVARFVPAGEVAGVLDMLGIES